MNKFVPCNKCNNGYIYDEKTSSVKRCDCWIKYQKEVKLELALDKANLTNFDITLEDYHGRDSIGNLPKLKSYINNINTKFKGRNLYFYGDNGTQKSTVAKVILKESLKQGLTGKFILMKSLLDILSDVFHKDENSKEIDFLLNCDVLIIDDCFSKKKVTLYKNADYQMSFLDSFLRERIEQNRKNTIFTANVPILEIEDNGFSHDIQNLLLRDIYYKDGALLFNDLYISKDEDFKIDSMWD